MKKLARQFNSRVVALTARAHDVGDGGERGIAPVLDSILDYRVYTVVNEYAGEVMTWGA